jgi:hypothetical protein
MKLVLPSDVSRVPELGDIVIVPYLDDVLRAGIISEEPEPDAPGRHRVTVSFLTVPPFTLHVAPATELGGDGWFWRATDVLDPGPLKVRHYARYFNVQTQLRALLDDLAIELVDRLKPDERASLRSGGKSSDSPLRELLVRYEEIVGVENLPDAVQRVLGAR